MFDNWDVVSGRGSVFRQGALSGALLDRSRLVAEDADLAELATAVIYAAGESFGDDFYDTWNGHADVRLFVDGDIGVMAVMDMARAGDDDGPSDTPTFAWRRIGDQIALVGSREWRDSTVAEALDIEWPDRADFERLIDVQGWGE